MIKQCCALLEQRQQTVAFIESASSQVTYVASFLFIKIAVRNILLGGLVSYDPNIKREILKVSAEG